MGHYIPVSATGRVYAKRRNDDSLLSPRECFKRTQYFVVDLSFGEFSQAAFFVAFHRGRNPLRGLASATLALGPFTHAAAASMQTTRVFVKKTSVSTFFAYCHWEKHWPMSNRGRNRLPP